MTFFPLLKEVYNSLSSQQLRTSCIFITLTDKWEPSSQVSSNCIFTTTTAVLTIFLSHKFAQDTNEEIIHSSLILVPQSPQVSARIYSLHALMYTLNMLKNFFKPFYSQTW